MRGKDQSAGHIHSDDLGSSSVTVLALCESIKLCGYDLCTSSMDIMLPLEAEEMTENNFVKRERKPFHIDRMPLSFHKENYFDEDQSSFLTQRPHL